MRRAKSMLSVVVFTLTASGVGAQAKPSFAGEWKKVVAHGQGEPGVDLIITQGDDAMTVEERRGGQSPGPVKLTFTLDGSASTNAMAGRGAPTAQVSTAMWAGNTIVVTTTTGGGREKRTFSMDGGDLVVETSAPSRDGRGPNVTKVTYKRYERGHGG